MKNRYLVSYLYEDGSGVYVSSLVIELDYNPYIEKYMEALKDDLQKLTSEYRLLQDIDRILSITTLE